LTASTVETLTSKEDSELLPTGLQDGLQDKLDVGIPPPTTQDKLDVDVAVYHPLLLNERGQVRLRTVRFWFDFDDPGDRAQIIDHYKHWVNDSDYILIRARETERLKTKVRWMVIKAAKRGNDVSNRKLQRRLTPIRKALSQSDFSIDGVHSRLLYFTLTWDTELCSASESWERVNEDYNRLMSSLRKKFGKVHGLRAWESSERGYAHVHFLALFSETSFVYHKHVSKQPETYGKVSWRITDKWRKSIQKMWHSYIDVQAVVDNGISRLNDVLSYVVKFDDNHVDPEKWNEKELLTMVALWVHRKRQFGVSGAFADDLTRRLVVTQTVKQVDLHGSVVTVVKYDFIGLVNGREAGLDPSIWFKTYDRPPPFRELAWRPYSTSRAHSLDGMGFK